MFLLGWSISRGANLQKYTFKRWPDRKILYSGLWGAARHVNYMGEGFHSLAIARIFGHFANPKRQHFPRRLLRGSLRSPHKAARGLAFTSNSTVSVKVLDFVLSGGRKQSILRTFRWEVRL